MSAQAGTTTPERSRCRHPQPVATAALAHARSRHAPTEAERRLSASLRAHRLGPHIRRQHPIGDRFIVDFFCPEAKQCIEIDGDHHADPARANYDRPAPHGSTGAATA